MHFAKLSIFFFQVINLINRCSVYSGSLGQARAEGPAAEKETSLAGSRQSEGRNFSPVSTTIPRESFCLLTDQQKDRVQWIIDSFRWIDFPLSRITSVVCCITWKEGSIVHHLVLNLFVPLQALGLNIFHLCFFRKSIAIQTSTSKNVTKIITCRNYSSVHASKILLYK